MPKVHRRAHARNVCLNVTEKKKRKILSMCFVFFSFKGLHSLQTVPLRMRRGQNGCPRRGREGTLDYTAENNLLLAGTATKRGPCEEECYFWRKCSLT